MPNNQKTQRTIDETLGVISGALTVLNNYPQLNDSNLSVSLNAKPFDFIMRILYHLVGYDKIVEFVSRLLVYELPVIENAVKAYLLTHLKLMFSCTMNPFISYDLIRYGVVFDLKTVDLMNILRFSPLDNTIDKERKYGKYYYFGCEEKNDIQIPDDLMYAEDFNAFLWYVSHRRIGEREVWYGYKRNPLKDENGVRVHKSINQKQTKKDGIITLEYNGRSSGLSDAEGNGMSIQTPFNNCIHVFIGNTAPIDSVEVDMLNQTIKDSDRKLVKFTNLNNDVVALLKDLDNELMSLEDIKNAIDRDEYRNKKQEIKTYIKYLENVENAISKRKSIADAISIPLAARLITEDAENNCYIFPILPLMGKELRIAMACVEEDMGEIENTKKAAYDTVTAPYQYRDIKDNYYYHRTLFEFNTDYIMSLKLFDEKTLAAQLLDALCGCLSVNLELSFEERVLKNEVERMVHDILDTDDTVVSDCFYSFDNDAYNQMLERSQLQRIGAYVSPGGQVGLGLSPEDVMNQLNNLSPNATNEQIQTAISSSLYQVSRSISSEYDNYDTDVNLNAQADFINNLLNTLAYVVVLSILSPKLYLLMAVNLKIMGREAGFDLVAFLESFKQMIAGVIRAVRDELMRLFKEWIMELIGGLAKDLAAKLALEQIMYYRELLQRCVECFKMSGGPLSDWNMADVDYADIYGSENNEPVNNDC